MALSHRNLGRLLSDDTQNQTGSDTKNQILATTSWDSACATASNSDMCCAGTKHVR